MAEMGPAVGTEDFGAIDAEGRVHFGCDVLCVCGVPEAWPAGTGVEFGVGVEQFMAAIGANVHAFGVIVDVFSAKRRLGAF